MKPETIHWNCSLSCYKFIHAYSVVPTTEIIVKDFFSATVFQLIYAINKVSPSLSTNWYLKSVLKNIQKQNSHILTSSISAEEGLACLARHPPKVMSQCLVSTNLTNLLSLQPAALTDMANRCILSIYAISISDETWTGCHLYHWIRSKSQRSETEQGPEY